MKKRKGKKSMKLGGGGRFAKVEREAAASGARNPAAAAEAAGRKKYGAKKMGEMAAAGRSRAARSKPMSSMSAEEIERKHGRDRLN